MLIDFTVENFRSIKEPVTLSAVAQRSRARKEPRVIPDNEIAPPYHVEGWDFDILPALGIFGANASGKSNVLLALDTVLDLMKTGSTVRASGTPIVSFALGGPRQRAMATKFEIHLEFDAAVYEYRIEISGDHIDHESMHLSPASTRRPRLLYQRDWDNSNNTYTWKNGAHFNGAHEQLEVDLDERYTYLSILRRLNVPVIEPLKQWLINRADRVGPDSESADRQKAAAECFKSRDYQDRMSALIRMLDTGILSLKVTNAFPQGESQNELRILTLHKTSDDEIYFNFELESSGTRGLFGLANNILTALDTGTLLIIDELGSNTHPHITHELVKMFQNPRTNPKHAQLIFASHDNTLMRDHLVRRDQIWFTEKGLDGVTKLFPLSDFKARNDTSIELSYFYGRYGAVPVTASPEEFESAIAAAS